MKMNGRNLEYFCDFRKSIFYIGNEFQDSRYLKFKSVFFLSVCFIDKHAQNTTVFKKLALSNISGSVKSWFEIKTNGRN